MDMKRIGVLTRDCAGVNTAIRAVVRTACSEGIEVFGIIKSYEGLMKGDFTPMDRRSVSGIINLGGSILKTARAEEFMTKAGRDKAAGVVRDMELDGLIVIGGNGSLAGAHIFFQEHGVPTVCVPATIDNDINGVDMSIGADTAINVATEALDKIRDTALSMERIFVVEVMGRESGYIALQVGLASGCEEVLLPERDHDIVAICKEIKEGYDRGKMSWIIVVAEGKAKAPAIAETINQITGLETRMAVLGHIQRGGRPTAFDRILAARLGFQAVKVLTEGGTDLCVNYNDGAPGNIPLSDAIRKKKMDIEDRYRLIKILT
jgi:6-phosphofructokinase 1